MLNHLLIAVFYATVGISLLFGLLTIVKSSLYDIKQARLRHQQKLHPHSRNLRRRPFTSVIIYAYNNSTDITDCLDAWLSSSYKKFQLIVVDNASQDNTAKVVRKYIKQRPAASIRLVAKRVASSRPQAIVQAAQYAQGEMLAIIDANATVNRQALKYAVIQSLQTSCQVVLFNWRIAHEYSLLGLADSLRYVLNNRVKKAGGFLVPGLDSHNYAALYTKEVFNNLAANSAQSLSDINLLNRQVAKIGYASQAVVNLTASRLRIQAFSSSKQMAARLLQTTRSFLSLIEPLVIGFMIYVAFKFNNSGYLVLAWLSFTGLFVLAVWSDETLGLREKLRLSCLSLVAYSLYLLRTVSSYPALLKFAR